MIHEVYYVMCMLPTLNNEMELTSFILFQNGFMQRNVFELL